MVSKKRLFGFLTGSCLALVACTIKVETCPDNQKCAPVVNINAEFCGEIIVGGEVMPVKCPADAGTDGHSD